MKTLNDIRVQKFDYSSLTVDITTVHERLIHAARKRQHMRGEKLPLYLMERLDPATGVCSEITFCSQPLYELRIIREESSYLIEHGFYQAQKNTQRLDRQDLTIRLSDILLGLQPKDTALAQDLTFYGFSSYESVELCESIRLDHYDPKLPLLQYYIFAEVCTIKDPHTPNAQYSVTTSSTEDLKYLPLNYPKILSSPVSDKAACNNLQLTSEQQSLLTSKQHAELVAQAKHSLQRGDVFQLVLSRKLRVQTSGDPLTLYSKLRSVNPSPYCFYFEFPDAVIAGASPELHLQVTETSARLDPIAGTCRRTGNARIDKVQATLLLQDEKEISEHVMLVDLARNDLSRFCKHVLVKEYCTVKKFSHVQHLVSIVSGELISKDSSTRFKLMDCCFPAGTLTGAPKFNAIKIISELEPEARGFYGGTVGHFSLDGRSENAIAIRSFLHRNNTLELQSGGGIVYASIPEKEVLEAYAKMAAILSCLSNEEETTTTIKEHYEKVSACR